LVPQEVFSSSSPGVSRRVGAGRRSVLRRVAMSDVWFVFLTLVLFGLLALVAKGMERL
jgi:Na+-driven multidrug efflux pump